MTASDTDGLCSYSKDCENEGVIPVNMQGTDDDGNVLWEKTYLVCTGHIGDTVSAVMGAGGQVPGMASVEG